MSEQKKPREFWVESQIKIWDEKNLKMFKYEKDAQEIKNKSIHVIEISALTELQAKYDELKGTLDLANDEYVKQVGTWKIIQRLEENEKRMQLKYDSLKEKADKLRGVVGDYTSLMRKIYDEPEKLSLEGACYLNAMEVLQEYDQAKGDD